MTPTTPTDAQMKLARELMTKAAPMFPITTHNGPDYADVTFAEDHSSQAMTMEPDTWNALNELFVSLPAIFDAIQATEARAQGLVEAERERCARIVERRAEARFAENGTREWDTNATYYQGGMAEIYEALDEEADEIADAIRNSQHGGERER